MADFNVPFLTTDEARGNRLAPEEMRLLQVAHLVQTICWIGCGLAVLAVIAQGAYSMSRPYWRIDFKELAVLKEKISEHNSKRAQYAAAIKRINQRLRMDQVAVPLLSAVQRNISLESVNYQESAEGDSVKRTLHVEGFSIEPDEEKIRTYMEQVKTSLQSSLSGYKVSLSLEESSSDPRTGNLRFSFKGDIQ